MRPISVKPQNNEGTDDIRKMNGLTSSLLMGKEDKCKVGVGSRRGGGWEEIEAMPGGRDYKEQLLYSDAAFYNYKNLFTMGCLVLLPFIFLPQTIFTLENYFFFHCLPAAIHLPSFHHPPIHTQCMLQINDWTATYSPESGLYSNAQDIKVDCKSVRDCRLLPLSLLFQPQHVFSFHLQDNI